MSFEDFAKRIASTPEATAGAAARAAELARKPFAEAFVNEVYPHWQGPLKTISGKQGVSTVTHSHVPGLFAKAEDAAPVAKWLVTESLIVSTHVGVRAVVCYAFAGDENDGIMARLAGQSEGTWFTFDHARTKVFTGPKAKLVEAAAADVPEAAALFGPLLVAGLDAREDRLGREAAERDAAEKARAEAEQKAKENAERRLKEETEAGAAAMLERREAAEVEKK